MNLLPETTRLELRPLNMTAYATTVLEKWQETTYQERGITQKGQAILANVSQQDAPHGTNRRR